MERRHQRGSRTKRSHRPMREDETQIERAFARAFGAGRRISRRRFMRHTGRGLVLAGSALTLQSILAACGIRPAGSASIAPAGGPLEWANWPAYIDIDDDGNYPTIVAFTEQTGIDVNYTEAIQDNADFFGTIRQDL